MIQLKNKSRVKFFLNNVSRRIQNCTFFNKNSRNVNYKNLLLFVLHPVEKTRELEKVLPD